MACREGKGKVCAYTYREGGAGLGHGNADEAGKGDTRLAGSAYRGLLLPYSNA